MKGPFKKQSIPLFLISIFVLTLTSCIKDFIGETKDNVTAKKEIGKILKEFAETEETKDGSAHAQLYLSNASTLNFVQKNSGNPFIANLTRDQWIGFYTSWDYEYFPVYTDIEFTIRKGMGLDSHLFQGFMDDAPDLFGNDIFVYVNTPDGWKILSISSTITAPDDATDYSEIEPIADSPNNVFNAFEQHFNAQEAEAFNALFINPTAPCFRFKRLFRETYTDGLHSAAAFFERLPQSQNGLEIAFQNLDIEIKDQFTASVSGTYVITRDGKNLEKGQLLGTMAGTPVDGWKMTSCVFSISNTKIGFQ